MTAAAVVERAPRRPALRYHGGKWVLAPWIITHLPEHYRTYVEPYGGAASVLLRKPRSHGEVYNDVDGEIVNVFRVLQNPDLAEELRRLTSLTPYARAEFNDAEEPLDPAVDPVRAAWRTIVRSFMGHGSDSITIPHTGFRANANRNGTTPAQDWTRWPSIVADFTERLRGVVIECRPAIEIIKQHDTPRTVIYADPPYVLGARSTKVNHGNANGRQHGYRFEMTDVEHRELAGVLRGVRGMVVLSGYRSALYDELYGDWRRVTRKSFGDGAVTREECLWLSPAVPLLRQSSLVRHES